MGISLGFGPADLARCRFAISPAFETLAAGTVSEHLKVLREAGLVTGERHRHEIRYRRTPMGTALVEGQVR